MADKKANESFCWTHQALLCAYYEATGKHTEDIRKDLQMSRPEISEMRRNQEYRDRVKMMKQVIANKTLDIMVDHFVIAFMNIFKAIERKTASDDVDMEKLKDLVDVAKKLFDMIEQGKGLTIKKVHVEHEHSGSVEYTHDVGDNLMQHLDKIQDEGERAKAEAAILHQAEAIIVSQQAKGEPSEADN